MGRNQHIMFAALQTGCSNLIDSIAPVIRNNTHPQGKGQSHIIWNPYNHI